MITQVSKALSRQSSGKNHKKTQQGVSTKLEFYIYKVHMVHATNNYVCPYVHAPFSCSSQGRRVVYMYPDVIF